jgi:prolipoprotein diacylglyceryltransferase
LLWIRLVHHETHFEREGESLEKLDSLFIWTVLATLIGARLGHVFFMIGNIIAITYLKLFYRFVLLQILNLQDIKVGKSAILLLLPCIFTAKRS